jgi:hypothetical protein
MPLIPERIKEQIKASIDLTGSWRSTGRGYSVTLTGQQIASLRTWAQRNGLYVTMDGVVVVVTNEKPKGIGDEILEKIKSRQTAFVVAGSSSTVRNFVSKYNEENGTEWKVSQKPGGKSFVIYKLPAKVADDPREAGGPYVARGEDC